MTSPERTSAAPLVGEEPPLHLSDPIAAAAAGTPPSAAEAAQAKADKEAADEEELFLPPGRMRVFGGEGSEQQKLIVPAGLSNILRRKVDKVGNSPRSRSPSINRGADASTTALESNSSMSSLDDLDQDILLDRLGMLELDLPAEQRKMHASREFINLPPVTERMTEDTLDDTRAFCDVATTRSSSNASRANSMAGSIATGGEGFLEALDELEEEDFEDDLSDIDENGNGTAAEVIVVDGMEHLALEDHSRAQNEGTTRGSSSLHEEAPSAPTA